MINKLYSNKILFIALIQLLLLSLVIESKSINLEWVKKIGGTSGEFGKSLINDKQGNIYCVGNFLGTTDFDPGTGVYNLQAAGSYYDIFITKLNSNGQFLWAKQIGGISHDEVSEIKIDSLGDIYVCGIFSQTVDFDPGINQFVLTSNGGYDAFVLCLDSLGQFKYCKSFGGNEDDRCYSLAVNKVGEITISGYYFGMVDFDPGPQTFIQDGYINGKMFVVQLDSIGQFHWAISIGNSLFLQTPKSLTIDQNSNIIVSGMYQGFVDFDPSTATYSCSSESASEDIFILKLDPNGNFIWVKTIGGSGLDYANAALTCMNNDIVLTGKFTATVDFDPGASIYNLYGTGNSMFIAKIDSNGNFIWAKQIGQPDGGETFSIATDLQNNIYTTGHYFYSGPADFDPSVNNYYLSSNDGSAVDIFISKIDINGNFMAAYSIDCHTNYDASSYSIIVDSFSNIFITGVLIDSITFDSTGLVTLYASGPGDIFIAKYSQCNSSSTFSSASSCDSFYWEKSNLYYSASGLYYHYGVNSMGCLVVDSLSLTINHPTTATYNQTSCSTYFWPVSQLTYAQSGLYTYATIDSITGCSIFHELNLEVKPQPTVVSPGNQNYCNGQSVAAIPLSGSPANVVFDISGGAARGMPNQLNTLQLPAFVAGPSGTSVVTLLPHANGCTGNAVTYNLAVSNCPPLTLNLKFYIQGYYTSNGYMQNVLYNEGVSSEPLSVNCDYVIVELHSAQAPYAMIKTTIATLKTNGTLQCNFPGSVTNTPFYIVVHHRNTLTTWSHAPVMMTSGVFYNFSDQASKAYGDNQLEMEPGIFAFFNGDLNQEENIDLLDATILEADVFDFVSGYYDSDLNGDGNTDLLDVPILDMNMFNFVYAQHP